jgi:glucose-6-phosphate dehydrogenase assembly protein OpcA
MTTQQIVSPAQIESELLRIWDSLDKTRQMRASLFNLIVFNRLSTRTDYIRNIVQKIIDTFPCRVLFVTHDPDPHKHYLKTAVSVIASKGPNGTVCDDIDIGVAGAEWERVPYVILPHLLPDLPIYLLWAEDPNEAHPLFQPLAMLSTRIIFDSESAEHLRGFSQSLLSLKEQKGRDIADLNWARMEGWRDLLASTFDSKDRIHDLNDIQELSITFNARKTDFFCHLKIQAMYLLGLVSSRLGWNYQSMKKTNNRFCFEFDNDISASIESAFLQDLPPGSILSMKVVTKGHSHYEFVRNDKPPFQVTVQISTHDRCELPFQFVLGKSPMGQSLVREIFLKGTSPFFLETLRQLQMLDRGDIC